MEGIRSGLAEGRKTASHEKKAPILWVIIELIHTFASPFEKWDLAYVSTNQNQITVLRSQFGGQICRKDRKNRPEYGRRGNRSYSFTYPQEDLYRTSFAARKQEGS